MEKELNELVAKVEKLNADAEGAKEQLNPELQRELGFAVLCELMDTRNYHWQRYCDLKDGSYRDRCLGWDYKHEKDEDDQICYDPKLVAKFILASKEHFSSFMDICKSVKALEMYSSDIEFHFDKDVCMTKYDPIYQLFHDGFRSEECFFIQTLLKYVKRLTVYDCSDKCFGSLFPHLCEMKNLEELIIPDDCGGQLAKFLEMKPLKGMETSLDIFEKLDKKVKNYKLEIMVFAAFSNMERVFALSNFFPTEVHLAISSLTRWSSLAVNNAFVGTKILRICIGDTGDVHHHLENLCSQLNEMLLFADEFIGLVQKQMPKLEEISFYFHGLRVRWDDLNNPANQIKRFVDTCSVFIRKYQNTLKLNLTFVWRQFFGTSAAHEYMKKQFPDQKYDVRQQEKSPDYLWNGHINLAESVILDYRVYVSSVPL